MQLINSPSEIQTSTARTTSTAKATSTARATSGERKFSRMNSAVFLCAVVLSASNYECTVETGKNIIQFQFVVISLLVNMCVYLWVGHSRFPKFICQI